MNNRGGFIISLDFELHWGVFDHTSLNDKSRAYFRTTRDLIPPTLQLFNEYGIAATWATVGMLFARNKEELQELLPEHRPQYRNPQLDPYRLLAEVGENEDEDPYHYAPSLIELVAATPGQEIGSHTFSHFYCLEPGQDSEAFADDLGCAQRAANGYGPATSLVFPRNQYRTDYFPALRRHGFRAFRGNPETWFWQSRSGEDTTLYQRAVRLTDNYLPLAKSYLFDVGKEDNGLVNIPASRFFRPYVPSIDSYGGQQLKLWRICKEMTRAAEAGKNYHLWWHPHNLATDPARNMAGLEEILRTYKDLNQRYGWQSHSMESWIEASPQN
ncbi:polysaccharide deacetylase [Neolewinella xylanilytica]|uniref:Polysaccharide deacetylase n=1 Tax=Neolewinella xylanilytica TaxID=1514080 RepID=A0A2S6I904_9BACT|nr:polysaccharide deacetylase family protein [Neolewinella xylanilytica]PPK87973.1 polysaccharide deacetylase [Neolewinella xylanilytica]